MNNTAIARLALEGGLGIGTITGTSYAAQYSQQLAVQDAQMAHANDKSAAIENRWMK